jgi:hypothetical protein
MKISQRMALSIICRLPSEFVDMIAEGEGEDAGKNWKLTMTVLSKLRRKFNSQKEELETTRDMLATKIKRACGGCEYNVGNNHPMCKECLRVQWYTDNYKSK